MGFYSLWLLLIVAMTGMLFGIEWFRSLVYAGAGGEKSTWYESPVSAPGTTANLSKPAIDLVWEKMLAEHPDAASIEVHTVDSDTAVIAANANTRADVYWTLDYRYFDQYSLEELSVDHIYGRLKDADGADKLMRMNYDIHVGAILGFPGKVLVFLLSLTAASLPVTGTMIWWGRRRKRVVRPSAQQLVEKGASAQV